MIIAIDPGKTTGIAVYDGTTLATEVLLSQTAVWDRISPVGVDTVVIERFSTADYLSKYGLLTIEIVGGVKAICYQQGKTLVVHSPQNRSSMQETAHTHLKGKNVPFMIHEEDALAHMLYYLATGK